MAFTFAINRAKQGLKAHGMASCLDAWEGEATAPIVAFKE
jgi:hypothetical protein